MKAVYERHVRGLSPKDNQRSKANILYWKKATIEEQFKSSWKIKSTQISSCLVLSQAVVRKYHKYREEKKEDDLLH